MKVHLLHQAQDFDFDADLRPGHEELVQDLELTALLQAMSAGDDYLFTVARKVLLTPLGDPSAIRYRQGILTDCRAQPTAIREMYAIAAAALQDKRGIWSGYGGSYQTPQSSLSGAVGHLEAYVARLRQLRQLADDHASTFGSDGLKRLCAVLQTELDDEYFEEINRTLKQLRFRAGVLISARLGRDNSAVDLVLRDPGDARRGWKERLGIGPRSSYSFALSPRDEAGGQILADLTNRGVNAVANAAAQSADHIGSYFTVLRAELGFYVSCLNLAEKLTAKGAPVSVPEPLPSPEVTLSCTDLRDASLELQSEQPVIGNDVHGDSKSLIIITGANSGGKSTFLRSAGLAQLMMQCGLFVTAQSYQANTAAGIFTHFIREEDPDLASGRLDEELQRMSALADQIVPGSLVLFNESFAGTNEREGSEISQQIVRALLEAHVKVLFVTHRFGFAEYFYRQHENYSLFLRAERDPDGHRNYRLEVREPLATSFGEDLYYQLGAWLDEDQNLTSGTAGAQPPTGGGDSTAADAR